jgi:hypothetical protein
VAVSAILGRIFLVRRAPRLRETGNGWAAPREVHGPATRNDAEQKNLAEFHELVLALIGHGEDLGERT